MFENIDEATINTANTVIKEVYLKITNEILLSVVTKEDILERDFNNVFIFEDFFDEYLAKNRHIDGFKQELIEDMVDTIEANMGDIDIFELYDAVTGEGTQKLIKEKENPAKDDYKIFGKKVESKFELKNGNETLMNLADLDYDYYFRISEKVAHDNKKKNMKIKLPFSPTKNSEKIRFNEETIINTKKVPSTWKKKR